MHEMLLGYQKRTLAPSSLNFQQFGEENRSRASSTQLYYSSDVEHHGSIKLRQFSLSLPTSALVSHFYYIGPGREITPDPLPPRSQHFELLLLLVLVLLFRRSFGSL